MNPNITWDIVQDNLNFNWNYSKLSSNPNITWEIIKNNPEINWDYNYISGNPNINWEIVNKYKNETWDKFQLANNSMTDDYNDYVKRRYAKDILSKYLNPDIADKCSGFI